MADISKITLPNEITYDIKDTTARGSLATKQDALISGTNIKTINNESLLGSGNITIQGGGDSLPDQTGHSGEFLTTDGTDTSWAGIPNATDAAAGIVKTSSSNGISLNASGQLVVSGRLGQMSNTTGIYSPNTISPTTVGNGSLLVTEASGTTLGAKSLSVTTGFNLTLSTSHAAGSTTYTVTNNYANRILCTIALSGRACLNEANAANTVNITSIKVGTETVAPSSTDSSTVITITTASSANPSSATSSIRIYPKQDGFSNLLFGVSGTRNGYGYSIVGGQNVGNSSNGSAVFGNTQWNQGNSSLLAGRQHINTKQNAFLAGYGHNTTSGSTEVAAVGKWSNITSTTSFAVGGGSSNTSRSNLFEVTSTGRAILGSAPTGNMDAVTKGYVDTAIGNVESVLTTLLEGTT